MSYAERLINVTFALGKNTVTGAPAMFDEGGNTVTLSGLRASASVTNSGGISQGALDLRVYGVTPSVIGKLMVVGPVPLVVQAGNTVTVQAGTADSGMSIVYQGTIASAWPNYEDMPSVPLHVIGLAALEAAVKSVPPSSYQGSADVGVVMGNLAKLMGMGFENGGVSVQLANPYFSGTAYQQAETCAQAAGINMTVDRGTLAIWPRGGSRGGVVPLISPGTGLVGYPIRTPLGVELRTLYNPAIVFGAKVEVQSSLQPACGTWQVTSLDHTLESMTPGGAWFSRLTCLPVGFV